MLVRRGASRQLSPNATLSTASAVTLGDAGLTVVVVVLSKGVSVVVGSDVILKIAK